MPYENGSDLKKTYSQLNISSFWHSTIDLNFVNLRRHYKYEHFKRENLHICLNRYFPSYVVILTFILWFHKIIVRCYKKPSYYFEIVFYRKTGFIAKVCLK